MNSDTAIIQDACVHAQDLSGTPYERIIEDASEDPRFDTFAKRLFFFQRKGETDRQFAGRLGQSLKTLQGWKNGGKKPRRDTVKKLSEKLDVNWPWLWIGMFHHKEIFKSGFKLTVINRRPYYVEERVDGSVQITGGPPRVHTKIN